MDKISTRRKGGEEARKEEVSTRKESPEGGWSKEAISLPISPPSSSPPPPTHLALLPQLHQLLGRLAVHDAPHAIHGGIAANVGDVVAAVPIKPRGDLLQVDLGAQDNILRGGGSVVCERE